MLEIETQNKGTWTAYGAHQLARDIELPELDGWSWDIPGAGPGAEFFGDVPGLRVLDVGSGLGRHAARMASLGAKIRAPLLIRRVTGNLRTTARNGRPERQPVGARRGALSLSSHIGTTYDHQQGGVVAQR